MTRDYFEHKPVLPEEIQYNIDQYGCYIIQVKPDDYLPGFAYTIGLFQKFNHPEIICFGLPLELLGSILNNVCDLIKDGTSLQTGILYSDFITDFPVQFLLVDKSFYPNYWGIANNFYHHHHYPAL